MKAGPRYFFAFILLYMYIIYDKANCRSANEQSVGDGSMIGRPRSLFTFMLVHVYCYILVYCRNDNGKWIEKRYGNYWIMLQNIGFNHELYIYQYNR